ncbi:hypothetical protein L1887_60206 [Cichorium endivia]|nr:hypothetical protein L1887_60206 [Cichorium endivia]
MARSLGAGASRRVAARGCASVQVRWRSRFFVLAAAAAGCSPWEQQDCMRVGAEQRCQASQLGGGTGASSAQRALQGRLWSNAYAAALARAGERALEMVVDGLGLVQLRLS